MMYNLKTFLIQGLRRLSYRWPGRYNSLKLARISRGQYSCNICKGVFGNREIVADHKSPVIDPKEGFTTWDNYINRMFVDETGFQILCKPCHKIKTQEENSSRVRKKRTKKRKKK